jgi:hypothetical protein
MGNGMIITKSISHCVCIAAQAFSMRGAFSDNHKNGVSEGYLDDGMVILEEHVWQR